MKIRGNTVGTTIAPEKVLVKSEKLTPEEQAQARQNIGAMASVVDTDLDMNHKSIINVKSLEFDFGQGLSVTGDIFYNGGARLNFASNQGDKKVGLSGIAYGVDDTDAVTVGQLNKAIADAFASIANGDEVSY